MKLSKLSKGSPVPMTTILDILTSAAFCISYICSSISPEVRSLTFPPMPEAQKAHPILHPTCEDMHAEYPCSYFIRTLSIAFPSIVLKRNFLVPSSLSSSTFMGTIEYRSYFNKSFSLNAAGTLLISFRSATFFL